MAEILMSNMVFIFNGKTLNLASRKSPTGNSDKNL